MAVFAYRAIDGAASAVSGTVLADTPRDARDNLRARGLTVQEVMPRVAASPISRMPRFRRRFSSGAVVSFLRELSTLLAVGTPLVEAIDTVQSQYHGRFAMALLILRDNVSSGTGLAEAMRRQPEVFDELCASLIEVGENTGTLDAALEHLAEFKERTSSFRNRLATVLLYPTIVFCMAVSVSVILMTLVVPNLLNSIQQSGHALPLPTRMVKAASDLIVAYGWLMLIGLVAVVVGIRLLLRSQRGRRWWHRTQLRIPVLGPLIRRQAIVRLCVVLSGLLRSGVVFVRAIEIARRTIGNVVIADALEQCEQAVQTGRDISESLDASGAFPPVVVRVFAVGQQSGRLEELLDRLAIDYDRQVATASQRLTAVLEPVLILGLVALVGFIALATILPLLEAADVV